jgi:hypothetical protein
MKMFVADSPNREIEPDCLFEYDGRKYACITDFIAHITVLDCLTGLRCWQHWGKPSENYKDVLEVAIIGAKSNIDKHKGWDFSRLEILNPEFAVQ